jgi:hypothetical protein
MQARLTSALVRRLTEEVAPIRDTTLFDVQLPRFALRLKPPSAPGAPWASLYTSSASRSPARRSA